MGDIVLTVSILVSNNYANVRRCLESVKPLLEAVPSELILTDTGCDRLVRDLLETYTNHIIEFEWCQDFSAARNVGLREAKGEWFLYIDDDEWFEDVRPLVAFFTSEESCNYNAAFYIQRNHIDHSGTNYVDYYVDRILRRQEQLHFVHRVHEAYTGIDIGDKKVILCVANHDGYIYANEEEKHAKHVRNQKLLEMECKENPEDMRMRYQLVINQYDIQDWDGAIAYAVEGIDENPDSNSEYWDACHTSILYCLEKKGDWEQVIQSGKCFLKKKLYPLDSFGTLQYLMRADYHLKRFEELCRFADVALDIYSEYKKTPQLFNPNQLMRQDFIDEGSLWSMVKIILVAAMITQNEDLLYKLATGCLKEMVRDITSDATLITNEIQAIGIQ